MAEADDIRLMLATSDDVFSDGKTSSPCFVNAADEIVTDDEMGRSVQQLSYLCVLVATTDFPGIAVDQAVTLNGADYTISGAPRRVQDGAMLLLELQEAKK